MFCNSNLGHLVVPDYLKDIGYQLLQSMCNQYEAIEFVLPRLTFSKIPEMEVLIGWLDVQLK
jgi:hypothetical protein